MREWARRNAWGLIALVPLLGLALAASSSRLLSVYLPWEAPSPIDAEGSIVLTIADQPSIHYPKGVEPRASFTPASVEMIESAPSETSLIGDHMIEAAPGAKLWRIRVDAQVDPDYALQSCLFHVEGDDGAEYDLSGGKAEDGAPALEFLAGSCAPPGSLGPGADFLTGEWTDTMEVDPRPSEYGLTLLVGMPEGVVPKFLALDLGEPGNYWRVPLPEAQ